MAGSRFPSDVRLLEWASREDFGRVRAEWLELSRRDVALLAADKLVLAEIGARLGFDRNHAWPSIPRLAADLGLSEPTVKRAIARAIERGYLTCEKRGFGGSNHYAMSASRSIANEVVEAHEDRIAKFIDTRRPSMRSPMIPMVEGASNEITGDPSMRSPMISHSDHPPSLNEITGDPLTLSSNPIKEADHRSPTERLGDRVEDRSLGEAARSQSDWQAISDARHDLISLFGDGDFDLGTRMFVALGKRATHLAELVAAEGTSVLADRIVTAKADAVSLLAKSIASTEVTP